VFKQSFGCQPASNNEQIISINNYRTGAMSIGATQNLGHGSVHQSHSPPPAPHSVQSTLPSATVDIQQGRQASKRSVTAAGKGV